MKQLSLIAVGVVVGFLVALRLGRGPGGRHLLRAVDSRTRSFTRAVADGYRSRDAELRTDG